MSPPASTILEGSDGIGQTGGIAGGTGISNPPTGSPGHGGKGGDSGQDGAMGNAGLVRLSFVPSTGSTAPVAVPGLQGGGLALLGGLLAGLAWRRRRAVTPR